MDEDRTASASASSDRDSSSSCLDSPAQRQAEARIGSVLRGKWRIERLLGVGGMGAVYAAVHRNGRRAAIKILLPFHGADRRTVQRFLKEGYVANELAHAGAVQIHDDDFTEDGLPFLVMELLEGVSLSAKLEELSPHHRLDSPEAIRIAADVLDVLAAAHARAIIHRDVKPDNIFLLADGRVKLLDFGIARLRSVSTAGTTTANGSLLGTPATMAPEQARGRLDEIDARSDVFGVGATLFTMLSGQDIRVAATMNELLLAAMTAPARPLREVAPDIAVSLAAIVDRALAFSREDRWPSAEAMRDALNALSGGFSSTEPRIVASISSPPVQATQAQATTTGTQDFAVVDGGRVEDHAIHQRRPRTIAQTAALGIVFALVVAGGAVFGVRALSQKVDTPPTTSVAFEAPLPSPPAASSSSSAVVVLIPSIGGTATAASAIAIEPTSTSGGGGGAGGPKKRARIGAPPANDTTKPSPPASVAPATTASEPPKRDPLERRF